MFVAEIKTPNSQPKRRPILELSAAEAQAFFFESDNYCTIDLPPYFEFGTLIHDVAQAIGNHLSADCLTTPAIQKA